MSELRVARRYARALLRAAVELGVLEEAESDIRGFYELLRSSKDLRSFLGDPTVWPKTKAHFLENLLKGKVNRTTLDFLLLTVAKGRSALFEDVLREFGEMLDEHRGVIAAQVRSAVELSPEQKARLVERLSAYSEKNVRLEAVVDRTIKGGVIVRLGDMVFDGSVEAQLRRLYKSWIGA